MNTGVCAAGEFRCSGDVLETCSVDRTGFTTVATCQAGLCDAAGKQCDNCKAGEGSCSGLSAGTVCSSDGQKQEALSCSGAAPFCAASGGKATCVACRTSVDCTASTNPCLLSVCSAEGVCGTSAVAAGAVCSVSGGTCDGAGSCRECAPNEKRCSGLQPQTCGADGKWVTALACQGNAPLCLGGECVQCAAAVDCPSSGNPCTQAVCSSGTCGYVAKQQGTVCPGGTCNASGMCSACTPGSKACNGNQLLSCNMSGQYDPPVSCAGGTPYCSAAAAACVQCGLDSQCQTPSNPCLKAVCSNNVCGVSAKPDGSACSVGLEMGSCVSGACVTCTNGSMRCKPALLNSPLTETPQSCVNGQWADQATCAGGQVCSNGACTSACGTAVIASRAVALGASLHFSFDQVPYIDSIRGVTALPVGTGNTLVPGLIGSGQAIHLGGSGHLEFTDSQVWNKSAFTVVAWAKPDTLTAGVLSTVVSQRDSNQDGRGWSIDGWNTGQWRLLAGNGTAWPQSVALQPATSGVKTFLAATVANTSATSSTQCLYRDSAPAVCLTTDAFAAPNDGLMRIGAWNGWSGDSPGTPYYRFVGTIDEVMFFPSALSDSEIASIRDLACP